MNIFKLMEHCIDYDIKNGGYTGSIVGTTVYLLGALLLAGLLTVLIAVVPLVVLTLAACLVIFGLSYVALNLPKILRWKK